MRSRAGRLRLDRRRLPPLSNHLEQARLQLSREPRALPHLVVKDRGQSLFDYEPEDFVFENYDPHPHIAAPIAV